MAELVEEEMKNCTGRYLRTQNSILNLFNIPTWGQTLTNLKSNILIQTSLLVKSRWSVANQSSSNHTKVA